MIAIYSVDSAIDLLDHQGLVLYNLCLRHRLDHFLTSVDGVLPENDCKR